MKLVHKCVCVFLFVFFLQITQYLSYKNAAATSSQYKASVKPQLTVNLDEVDLPEYAQIGKNNE